MTSSALIPDDFSDHVYATKHGVPLWLRVYPAPPSKRVASNGRGCPWLLWVHGGAYLSGQHYQLRRWLLPLLHARGYHVVSVSHRFAPYVHMEDMVIDCQDAYLWCIGHLAGLLRDKGGIAMGTYAVGGDSSGGGLATLLAHRLKGPSPKAVIDVYGVTDLVRQQQMYDNQPPEVNPWKGDVSEEELQKFYNDRDPSHAVTATTNMWNLSFIPEQIKDHGTKEEIYQALKKVWKVSDQEWKNDERVQRQWDVKNYSGYKKSMVTLSLRIDSETSSEEAQAILKKYSSPYILEKTKRYPPTVFLHGTGDRAVPVEESQDMAEALKNLNIDCLELYCEGKDHGWDNDYTVPTDEGWDEFIEPIGLFLDKHVKKIRVEDA